MTAMYQENEAHLLTTQQPTHDASLFIMTPASISPMASPTQLTPRASHTQQQDLSSGVAIARDLLPPLEVSNAKQQIALSPTLRSRSSTLPTRLFEGISQRHKFGVVYTICCRLIAS